MSLSSALSTGLSGLNVNQTWMNVIGNNIANINTTGFKASQVNFQTQLYVTNQSGTAPNSAFGGTNPSQTGLGSTVGDIQQDFSGGTIQSTGNPSDLAINGSGFFILGGAQQNYTRDGSFTLNSANQLVNSNGQFVQGFGVDTSGNLLTGQLQDVTIPVGSLTTAGATSSATFQGNLNGSGTVATGASILNSQSITTIDGSDVTQNPLLTDLTTTGGTTPLFTTGQTLTLNAQRGGLDVAPQTFTVQAGSTLNDLENFFQNSLGIDPTDTAGPPPGVTTMPDPNNANAVELVVTGNVGTDNALTLGNGSFSDASGNSPLTFSAGTNAAGTASDPNGASVNTSIIAYDSLGSPMTIDLTAVMESKSDAGNTWRFFANSPDSMGAGTLVGGGTVTFDSNGNLLSSTGTTITMDRTGTGAKTPQDITLNFSALTGLSSTSSSIVSTQQDGFAIGTLDAYSIGADGTITGTFSNGQTRTLGQVALATFNNPEGLVNEGQNQYMTGANSGVPIISAPTALGAGSLVSGSLESSNVDLSKEFTNMIVASTGFSANSRVLSTCDQMLTALLNSQQ